MDANYTNSEEFLASYIGIRYHLLEWRDGCTLLNYKKYFDMKYASAKNVIEQCFGLLRYVGQSYQVHLSIL